MNWQKITTTEDIDQADRLSSEKAVLIYKHSHRCNICTMALSRIERGWDAGDEARLVPFFLDVVSARDMSEKVAGRYGVRHESPQVLVIRGGKCIYDASHSSISYNEVMTAAAD